MTPKFITPCYVRVEDADKRKEICQQLERIGYIQNPIVKEIKYYTIIAEKYFYYDVADGCILPDTLAVDCGTNTELFFALAGMRSDTDKGQWFVLRGSIVSYDKCNSKAQDRIRNGWAKYATPAEIIEHFKMRGNRNEVPAAAANYDRKTTLQDIDYE